MTLAAVPPIAFARLPAGVADLLNEAAAQARAAVEQLYQAAREPSRAAELREAIAAGELEGDRIAHDLQREIGGRLTLTLERGHAWRLVDALDDVVDAIDDVAQHLSQLGDALADERRQVLVAILRDLVRATTGSVARLEEPADVQARRYDRVRGLRDEFRREARRARAEVVAHSSEPFRALRALLLLSRLATLSDAAARLANVVDVAAADLH